jgi:adenylate cyclase
MIPRIADMGWQVQVSENQQVVFTVESDPPLELGRQSDRCEIPYSLKRVDDRWRVIIARLEEHYISRRHALLEAVPPNSIRVSNLSMQQPVRLVNGADLLPRDSCIVPLPVTFTLGNKAICIQAEDADEIPLRSLEVAACPPGRGPTSLTPVVAPGGDPVALESLVRGLQGVLDVLHSAASSSDFLAQAARAVVELVRLDSCRVLMLEGDEWKTQTVQAAPQILPEENWQPSRHILNQVQREKKTSWEAPELAASATRSLYGVKVVVAAPILDRRGEVIGVLYGDRRREGTWMAAPALSKLDAMLVELIATGVAAGLARLQQEKAALTARIQFEQFFTAELARQLEAQPNLLEGRDAEVTILFCDIRGFSRFSERLGPAGTVAWIRDVMGVLSDCVLSHRGVVVDYIGDEVMAMWGAPERQPDHAKLACAAALAMYDQLPKLNARWQSLLGEPMGLGIGTNSGLARVGNTGSERKFKYGPLGNTVNLASRVQGANKYLKTKLLITGAVQAQLGQEFEVRQLCRARVVNIAEPVTLFELVGCPTPDWMDLKSGYEEALEKYESKEFRQAARILGRICTEHPLDGPALFLLSQAVRCMIEEPTEFDPVWVLPGK